MPGWLFEVLPSLHKEVIHNHHKKHDQLLDCCICMACLREVGYTNAQSKSWDLYSGVSITQKMLCQTAVYFRKVLVFQERTISNSP